MNKLLVLLLVLIVSGCASYGAKIDRNYVNEIKKGVTTEREVIAKLGAPMSAGYNSEGGKTLTYIHSASQAKASTFIPIVGAFVGGANTQSTILIVKVDSKTGIVTDWNYSQTDSEVNTGLAAN